MAAPIIHITPVELDPRPRTREHRASAGAGHHRGALLTLALTVALVAPTAPMLLTRAGTGTARPPAASVTAGPPSSEETLTGQRRTEAARSHAPRP